MILDIADVMAEMLKTICSECAEICTGDREEKCWELIENKMIETLKLKGEVK